ncbi:thiamine-phosphate kinase [Psittacicella gerlachiana]|uniref:Thiamine-monophosphate kinase n=1 Tax=Psittacicella gerlachiana TaxID=2028574 RepID=A0A3A1YL16_9GAMM|nr:thiamine-phosphate kinase [Psittacicella gerlachiana]RIY37919.1 thiamine-phosphate kinase [Psittacicella gerlachiana]
MALGEFNLIAKYFAQPQELLGHPMVSETSDLGDDCAIVQVKSGYDLLVTTDTMVENSHFYPEIHPYDLGYKAVVTNLSDIVSKGGIPTWVSLALTLPQAHPTWLEAFSQGLFDALQVYNVRLIGGDTVQGKELSVTITAQGTVAHNQAFTRKAAQVGDAIFVTGTLGAAYAGFRLLEALHQKYFANYSNPITTFAPAFTVGVSTHSVYQSSRFPLISSQEVDYSCFIKDPSQAEFYRNLCQTLIVKNLHPQTLTKFVQRFHGYVNASMDISDGLFSDLRHILELSQVNAQINLEALPAHPYLKPLVELTDPQQLLLSSPEILALKGGEDYQILFTVGADKVESFKAEIAKSGLLGLITQIGTITPATPEQLQAARASSETLAIGSNFVPQVSYYKNGEEVNLSQLIEQDIFTKTQDQELAHKTVNSLIFEHFN